MYPLERFYQPGVKSVCASRRKPYVTDRMDYSALVALATTQLGGDVPTAQNLMRIGIGLAQEVNKASALSGRAKLDLVVRALRGLLAEPVIRGRLTPEVAAALDGIVQDVIPETISLVVDASRGAFQLKKPSVGCVARILAILCRQAAAHVPGDVGKMAAQAAVIADAVSVDVEISKPESESEKSKDTSLTLRVLDEKK
jgi:hypothetical protein